MSRFIKTKADFTLRRKHKTGSGATIYETDYTTINPMPNALKGEYVIGDSNFVFTSRLGLNSQKKHVRGKFVPNPAGATDEHGAWTIDTMPDSAITDETKIRLKPNYSSIKDFACYGSAVKLVQGAVNGVITDFPAEMWFSGEEIKFYEPNNGVGLTFNECDEEGNLKTSAQTYTQKLLYNEYGIDILSDKQQISDIYNPLRFFALCGSSYTLIIGNNEYPLTSFSVLDTACGECSGGKNVEIDKIAHVTMDFSGHEVVIYVYKDYTDGSVYYTYGDEIEVKCNSKEIPVSVTGLFEQDCNQEEVVPVKVTGILEQDCSQQETIPVRVSGVFEQDCNIEPGPVVEPVTVNARFEQDCTVPPQPEPEVDPVSVTGLFQQTVRTTFGARSMVFGAPSLNLDGAHIRLKKELVEEYFNTCDDFTAVLLNRISKPVYKAILETPSENETGFSYTMESYVWPSLLGGFNPDLSGGYYAYVESLIQLAQFYDDFFTDNMWRSLTHEAIKTLDWTYVSNTDGDIQDMSVIDTSRIEPITKIYGRQFDDLKRYADAIKSINTITYNEKSNTPDYTLTDVLSNSGWETKTLKITSDKDVQTTSLYQGLSTGYTASDANNEFFRRLKLNSSYLLSTKGTRKGIDAMLALFGLKPSEYDVREYVYVFSGDKFPHVCCATTGNDEVKYPLADDIRTINKYKFNFNVFDQYGDYCGIPVIEIGYWVGDKNCSYVVPWFSQGKKYDDGLYFQMHGGWGKKDKMDIDLAIAPSVTSITGDDIYSETQARLKFAKDFDELLQESFASSNLHDVFYVTDISEITTEYTKQPGENLNDASHYFILENVDLYQYLGYSDSLSKYGWRSIANSEITSPNSAGTLVLYMESIKDDTTGNNPHIGNGTYDEGMSYVSGMSEIFAYSLLNKNFIGIDNDTCSAISQYRFDVERQLDNRKCWFFSDDYNTRTGKTICREDGTAPPGAETTVFREADVTDKVCNIKTYYEPESVLVRENATAAVGTSAENYFIDGNVYDRGTSLVPFDPEDRIGPNGESAANSIVNVKNLEIAFNLPTDFNFRADDKKAYRKYIEETIIPYLTQMLSSTSILKWTFNW